jgi:hypothetical protein
LFLASTIAGLCDTITIQPKIFPFNSFSLITGAAFDGRSIWLADMAPKTTSLVVRLDSNFAIAQRVGINGGTASGLMLASEGNGLVYAANDKSVWQISQNGTVKTFPTLGIDNCSQSAIAAGGSFVWLLSSCNAKDDSSSSAGSLLLRIDPKTGKRSVVALPGGGVNHTIISHGSIWVCGDYCSIIDVNTLVTKTFRPDGVTSVNAVAASGQKVYIAAQTPDGPSQIVFAIDPGTLKETARATVQDFTVNLLADDQNVVAFGQQQFHVLSAADLTLQRVITPSPTLQQFHADWTFLLNGDLVVVDDELGVDIPNRILLFQGWRPPIAPTAK